MEREQKDNDGEREKDKLWTEKNEEKVDNFLLNFNVETFGFWKNSFHVQN